MSDLIGEEKETEESNYECVPSLLVSLPRRMELTLSSLRRDPPTPLLPSSLPILSTTAPSTPPAQAPQLHSKSTSPVKLVSPKRQFLPRSPPRAKKVSLLKLPGLSLKMRNQQQSSLLMGSKLLQGGQSKRVYPRGAASGANGLSGLGLKEIGKKVAKQQNSIINS